MAAKAKSPRQFGFYIGTTGLTVANFVVDIFTKDENPVDSKTLNSFAIIEIGNGFYYGVYTPSVSGFYILAVTSSEGSGTRIIDVIDIDEANFINLSQDTLEHGALKPTAFLAKGTNTDLNRFLLLVFDSNDWKVGKTATRYATAMTELDANGNWLTTPLVVSPGTYHIVIRNNFGVTKVIASYLEV